MRRNVKSLLTFAAGILLVGHWTTPAHAVLLTDLLVPGATLTSGDKLFSNFNYLFLGDMPDPTQVNVVAITDTFGNFGIRIQGGFTDLPGGAASDATFGYDVTTLGSNIIDVHLVGNPAVIGGPGQFIVTETVFSLNPGPPPVTEGQLTIFDTNPGGPGIPKLDDALFLSQGYQSLRIVKDIFAFSQGGIPALSFMDQTFSQAMPEPSTFALAAMGALGLVGVIRRRKRA